MYVCTCMYSCIHVCMYSCMYVLLYVSMYVSRIWMYIRRTRLEDKPDLQTYAYVCIYMSYILDLCICMHIHVVRLCMQIHILRLCIFVCTYEWSCIYVLTQRRNSLSGFVTYITNFYRSSQDTDKYQYHALSCMYMHIHVFFPTLYALYACLWLVSLHVCITCITWFQASVNSLTEK